MSERGEETENGLSVRGHIRVAIEDLNVTSEREGVPVDDVVAKVGDQAGYSEDEVRAQLELMLREGEVYPPELHRVRLTE